MSINIMLATKHRCTIDHAKMKFSINDYYVVGGRIFKMELSVNNKNRSKSSIYFKNKKVKNLDLQAYLPVHILVLNH